MTTADTTTPDIKPRSRDVTDGLEKTAARGMLRAVGMGDDDWEKPQIGIASSWNEITPCNLSLDRLAKAAKEGVHAAGGYPLEFGTISVSDGISMGHEGMHFSLVSREVIADSVETVMQAERLDGSVLLAGCDKSLPGMLMAAARLDLAIGVPVRGVDRAGLGAAVGRHREGQRHDHRRVRGRRRVRARADEHGGRRPHRARDLPGRGRVRRHVHGQHDGVRRRGHGHVRARVRRPAVRRPPARRVRAQVRRGRGRHAAPGHHGAPDHDQGGLRERHRRGHGVRRFDQRGPAPARHRARGGGRAHAGRLHARRGPRCRTWAT